MLNMQEEKKKMESLRLKVYELDLREIEKELLLQYINASLGSLLNELNYTYYKGFIQGILMTLLSCDKLSHPQYVELKI